MDSILEERFSLKDLLDLSVLREVCEAYSRAFHVGIIILDENKAEMVEIRPDTSFCRAIKKSGMKDKCGDAGKKLARHPLDGTKVLQVKSTCGMRYALFPLSYQLEILGRVIVGPFRDPETPPEKITRQLGPDLAQVITNMKIASVPPFTPDELKDMISLLAKMLNAFLFINAKRLITTRLHLEAIYSSREDIFASVELQDSGSDEDKEEIERLKNMF